VFDATSFGTPAGGKAIFKGSDTTGWYAFVNSSGGAAWDIASGNSETSWSLNETATGGQSRFKLLTGGNAEFVTVTSTVTAGSFFQWSDIRFKNVLEYNPVIDLSKIDVIKYTFIEDTQIRYGYSAQQVKEYAPELVHSQPNEDKLQVKYIDVHTLKIAALEKKVAELEEKLNSLINGTGN
jgi:hypothetical protein